MGRNLYSVLSQWFWPFTFFRIEPRFRGKVRLGLVGLWAVKGRGRVTQRQPPLFRLTVMVSLD